MTSDTIVESSIPKTASLNLLQIVALYIGSVLGSGILILPGLTADMAGPASLLSWGFMSILSIPMALTMGLLSVHLPHAGGVSHFVSTALNPEIGSLVGYFFLVSAVMAVPIMAITGAGYVCTAFGFGEAARIIITVLILLTAVGSNYIGMQMTGKIQLAVVIGIISILVGSVLGSLPAISPVNLTPFLPHGWMSVGHAATLIFWCFLGWEAISHVTEEFENPKRDIVKGTIISAVIISILYLATIGAVIGTHSYGPGISAVSLIHLIKIAAGTNGMVIAGFITLFITIAPAIAYTGAASRLAFALAQQGSAPGFFSRLSPHFHTPVGGLIVLFLSYLIILAIYYSGLISLQVLIQIPNASFILTYMAGCLAGLILFRGEFLGMLVSGISFLLTGIILCFVGWAILCPVIITVLWGLYRMVTIHAIRRKLEARQRNS